LPTIASRCQRFAFRRVGAPDIVGRLQTVAGREGFSLEDSAANLLARLADGSMRDALALLDQCASGDAVDEALVLNTVGLAGQEKTAKLLAAMENGDTETALSLLHELYVDGKNMHALIHELSTLMRDILLTKIAPKGCADLLSGRFDREKLAEFSNVPAEWLRFALDQASLTAAELGRGAARRLAVELYTVRLCNAQLSDGMAALEARVAQIEKKLASGSITMSSPKIEETNAPPWNDADAPPQTPVPPKAAPKPAAKPSTANPDSPVWQQILEHVKPNLDVSVYTLLCDENEVTARLDGATLDVYIANGFTQMMIETQATQDKLKTAATEFVGQAVQIRIHSGKTPTHAEKGNLLDALAGLPNVTIK